jgi:hypothetical protein
MQHGRNISLSYFVRPRTATIKNISSPHFLDGSGMKFARKCQFARPDDTASSFGISRTVRDDRRLSGPLQQRAGSDSLPCYARESSAPWANEDTCRHAVRIRGLARGRVGVVRPANPCIRTTRWTATAGRLLARCPLRFADRARTLSSRRSVDGVCSRHFCLWT